LLALHGLTISAQLRSRRRRAIARAHAPTGPPPVHVDSNGMEWHEIQAPASPE
jgi:hypothetical protein